MFHFFLFFLSSFLHFACGIEVKADGEVACQEGEEGSGQQCSASVSGQEGALLEREKVKRVFKEKDKPLPPHDGPVFCSERATGRWNRLGLLLNKTLSFNESSMTES